ncbi:MAG: hypothetical protein B6D77_04570 [gamma proteobacterium symbiont of Ctena orbiculata]|nr:MAG: hypothetical protein B6D77_04570 [gamma proteobacterium symbiont of Ctena orbiculata]PVV23350.1 MAG: hypothetical protein B6D78_03180 [gamma proteobacterium symbiont of Ctena orbiculata]PVV26953.1 MAG: hypothetical protein B6D79_04640 [gamma proteobacterium symbiont of Ctena orbiculata]
METHKLVAIAIFTCVALYTSIRDGIQDALPVNLILLIFLLPILFYRIIAFFSGFGFPEYFAKDFKSDNHPGPYAFFFWIIYLIACLFILFDWRLY